MKNISDLFLDTEYIDFYNQYKYEKDDIVRMLEGNKNRMCVCETKEELFRQYYFATYRLQKLLEIRLKDFKKREELGYYEREE